MKKKLSSVFSKKHLLTISFVACLMLGNTAYAQDAEYEMEDRQEREETQTKNKKEEPLVLIEQMPQFPGGNEALVEFVGSNLKYPKKAATDNISGRVVTRFVVTKTGSISHIEVIKSLSKECDKEAMRVIKKMPKWIPGKQDGKAVPVYFTLPIMFKLREDGKYN